MRRQPVAGKPHWICLALSLAVLLGAGCSSSESQAAAYGDGPEADSLVPESEADQSGAGITGADSSEGNLSDDGVSGDDVSDDDVSDDDVSDDGVSEDDVVVFLAAGERLLKGTPYSGVLHESPELYVAAAQLICERLSAGDSVDDVVSDFITDTGLSSSVDADVTLAGTVLGAGVETLCPAYRHLL